ncbi:predicted protein [Lichtheimia corymbifera JMRC:FSU:9682]|uniref:Uncharacterized protein n=1 Tax=Lichtheimia corymbifera JMRC:FSU:9682 TaxID=1263082 RepID=A0A068S9E0_9FUNG|nr:predicted protein [Lichtheimia corymbifera JMRC:FSU:9682]
MSFVERADQRGAEIIVPMLFDEEEELQGFEIRVEDGCPFLDDFFVDGIVPFLVKIKPVGQVSERVLGFIQEVQEHVQGLRDD